MGDLLAAQRPDLNSSATPPIHRNQRSETMPANTALVTTAPSTAVTEIDAEIKRLLTARYNLPLSIQEAERIGKKEYEEQTINLIRRVSSDVSASNAPLGTDAMDGIAQQLKQTQDALARSEERVNAMKRVTKLVGERLDRYGKTNPKLLLHVLGQRFEELKKVATDDEGGREIQRMEIQRIDEEIDFLRKEAAQEGGPGEDRMKRIAEQLEQLDTVQSKALNDLRKSFTALKDKISVNEVDTRKLRKTMYKVERSIQQINKLVRHNPDVRAAKKK
jgi:hypothetical protein